MNFCSRFLRLSVVPRCRERPQIAMCFLEWLGRLNNVPHFLRKVSVSQGLVRSDHSVVLVLYHRIPLKAKRKTVMLRNVRDRHNLEMDNLLKFYNWGNVY